MGWFLIVLLILKMMLLIVISLSCKLSEAERVRLFPCDINLLFNHRDAACLRSKYVSAYIIWSANVASFWKFLFDVCRTAMDCDRNSCSVDADIGDFLSFTYKPQKKISVRIKTNIIPWNGLLSLQFFSHLVHDAAVQRWGLRSKRKLMRNGRQ